MSGASGEPGVFVATYRLQLGPGFDLHDAAALVPYLRDLGVSHLHLSPVWKARRGSTHGYDVVDPRVVSEALGGETALRALAATGLGIVLDVVPNHMAACDENPFWADPVRREQFFDLDRATGRWRRFFDIDDLAGVRVEDEEVFRVTHAKVLELVADGVARGLRVDHVDGLADPRGYLERLRAAGVEHVWVEKILEPGEELRDWSVEGTTGYEMATAATALFVAPEAEAALARCAGDARPFAEVAAEAKREQVATTFRTETERLRAVADLPGLEAALAALPVYRTYVEPARGRIAPADREAVALLPVAVRAALLLEREASSAEPVSDEFVVRFQQTTGAVMAKGVEDTALYRYVRLLALNEVGGDPARFGTTVEEFHAANRDRAARWPRHLLAATTHDTKRSADVRARIAAITTDAWRWHDLTRTWRARHHHYRRGGAPDAVEEQYLYQTLAGAWPIDDDRLARHLQKALREMKRATSWIEPDEEHERAVVDFARAVLADPEFRAEFDPLVTRLAAEGARTSVAQVALRATSPGVPDLYQGDELWNLLLVDPDNRRPVDWGTRLDVLATLRAGAEPTIADAKLFATWQLLALRTRHRGFVDAPYTPVPAGARVCAYDRGDAVRVVVPLRDETPTVALAPEGTWADVLAPLGPLLGPGAPHVYERVR